MTELEIAEAADGPAGARTRAGFVLVAICLCVSGCLFFEDGSDSDPTGPADAGSPSDVLADVHQDSADAADVGSDTDGMDASPDAPDGGGALDPGTFGEVVSSERWAALVRGSMSDGSPSANLLAVLRAKDEGGLFLTAGGFYGEGHYDVSGNQQAWQVDVEVTLSDVKVCEAIKEDGYDGVAAACAAWIQHYGLTDWQQVELTGRVTPEELQSGVLRLHPPDKSDATIRFTPAREVRQAPPTAGPYTNLSGSHEAIVEKSDAWWAIGLDGTEGLREFGRLIRFGGDNQRTSQKWGAVLPPSDSRSFNLALVGGLVGERGFDWGTNIDALQVPFFSMSGDNATQFTRRWLGLRP